MPRHEVIAQDFLPLECYNILENYINDMAPLIRKRKPVCENIEIDKKNLNPYYNDLISSKITKRTLRNLNSYYTLIQIMSERNHQTFTHIDDMLKFWKYIYELDKIDTIDVFNRFKHKKYYLEKFKFLYNLYNKHHPDVYISFVCFNTQDRFEIVKVFKKYYMLMIMSNIHLNKDLMERVNEIALISDRSIDFNIKNMKQIELIQELEERNITENQYNQIYELLFINDNHQENYVRLRRR